LREAIREMQTTTSSRLVLEGALIGMARSELDTSAEALSARLGRLEGEVEKSARIRASETPSAASPQPRPAPPREDELHAAGIPLDEGERAPAVSGTCPEPEPPLTHVEQAGAAQLDLTAIRRAWPAVKDKVKEKKITTHAFLLEGKPLEFAGGELCIAFPADRSFHRGEMEKKDHREVLERALEEVLGVAVKVRTRLEEEEKSAPREAAGGTVKGRRQEPHSVESAAPEPAGQEKRQDTSGEEEAESEVLETPGKNKVEEKERSQKHDAGKVKLVKDIFGAEMIEEIKLGE
jgi:hypothetical protein